MTEDFDPEAMMDVMSGFLGLKLPPESRANVAFHLKSSRSIAAPLFALPLDDEAEPAPVFRA